MVDEFYRPELVGALELLSEAFSAVEECGHRRPVLVGGAVAEIVTLGEFISGDLDVVTPQQELFERELEKLGFERSVGPGAFSRGFQHKQFDVGVEVVGSALLDGRASYDRVYLLRLDSGRMVDLISVEDLIADRLGQYNCPPNYDEERLDQAIKIYQLADELDQEYLDKRIVEETMGDFDLKFLEERANAGSLD